MTGKHFCSRKPFVRALHVTGDGALRGLVASVLSDAGFVVDSVADGMAALARLSAFGSGYYDVVVLDLVLPRLNGLDVLRSLRVATATRRLPVLVTTGSLISARDFSDDGYTYVLPKPFSGVQLVAALTAITCGHWGITTPQGVRMSGRQGCVDQVAFDRSDARQAFMHTKTQTPWRSRMVRTLLTSALLIGTATLAYGQSATAPLLVTATVVSTCRVNVPRQVQRAALSTMPVDIECARGGVDARVRRPLLPLRSVDHALLVINF